VIVFLDGDGKYRPTTISSRQVHVVLVVKPENIDGEQYYQLGVVSKEGVPTFGPPIPENGTCPSTVLSAEKASYSSPILGNKLTRTRTALLKDIAQSFC